jgi:hypothetical protein
MRAADDDDDEWEQTVTKQKKKAKPKSRKDRQSRDEESVLVASEPQESTRSVSILRLMVGAVLLLIGATLVSYAKSQPKGSSSLPSSADSEGPAPASTVAHSDDGGSAMAVMLSANTPPAMVASPSPSPSLPLSPRLPMPPSPKPPFPPPPSPHPRPPPSPPFSCEHDEYCTDLGNDCCAPSELNEEASCSHGYTPVRTGDGCFFFRDGAYKCCTNTAPPPPPPFLMPMARLAGGGSMPMFLMGGDDFGEWFKKSNPIAGIQTFYSYRNGPHIAPQLKQHGRANVFVSTGIPCGCCKYDAPRVEPMTKILALGYIDEEIRQLDTNYVDLLLFHHRCRTAAQTASVWEAFEETKRLGRAKHSAPADVRT